MSTVSAEIKTSFDRAYRLAEIALSLNARGDFSVARAHMASVLDLLRAVDANEDKSLSDYLQKRLDNAIRIFSEAMQIDEPSYGFVRCGFNEVVDLGALTRAPFFAAV